MPAATLWGESLASPSTAYIFAANYGQSNPGGGATVSLLPAPTGPALGSGLSGLIVQADLADFMFDGTLAYAVESGASLQTDYAQFGAASVRMTAYFSDPDVSQVHVTVTPVSPTLDISTGGIPVSHWGWPWWDSANGYFSTESSPGLKWLASTQYVHFEGTPDDLPTRPPVVKMEPFGSGSIAKLTLPTSGYEGGESCIPVTTDPIPFTLHYYSPSRGNQTYSWTQSVIFGGADSCH